MDSDFVAELRKVPKVAVSDMFVVVWRAGGVRA